MHACSSWLICNGLISAPCCKPLLGINIRGGDKAFEDKIWGERSAPWVHKPEWIANVRDVLQVNGWQPGGTCLIYSDDLGAMYEASKRLRAELNCMTIQMGGWDGGFYRAAWTANGMAGKNTSGVVDAHCSATTDLVLQVEALSAADVFVGSFNSNLGRLIDLLRFHKFGKPRKSSRDVLNISWHHDYRAKPSNPPSN